MIPDDNIDPGTYLREYIFSELENSAAGFKGKLFKLHECLVAGNPLVVFKQECSKLVLKDIQRANQNISWKSDAFITTIIMYLTSPCDDGGYKKHLASIAEKLLEESIVSIQESKRCGTLEVAYELALAKVEKGQSIAIAVNIFDLGNMDTSSHFTCNYTHSFTMTITLSGVYIYQAYGGSTSYGGTGQGYTLLEYLQAHPTILSHSKGRLFVKKVTRWMQLSVDDKGRWSQEANDLYNELFEVDLVTMGHMKLGAKFDPYLLVEMHHFTIRVILENCLLLPACNIRFNCDEFTREKTIRRRSSVILNELKVDTHTNMPSDDIAILRSKIPSFIDYPKLLPLTWIDPLLQTCVYCDFSSSWGIGKCAKCQLVSYCCREHQRKHLSFHKDLCIAPIYSDIYSSDAATSNSSFVFKDSRP